MGLNKEEMTFSIESTYWLILNCNNGGGSIPCIVNGFWDTPKNNFGKQQIEIMPMIIDRMIKKHIFLKNLFFDKKINNLLDSHKYNRYNS